MGFERQRSGFWFHYFRDVGLPEAMKGWLVAIGRDSPSDPDDDAAVIVDRDRLHAVIYVSDRLLGLDVDRPGSAGISAAAMAASVDAVQAALRRQGF